MSYYVGYWNGSSPKNPLRFISSAGVIKSVSLSSSDSVYTANGGFKYCGGLVVNAATSTIYWTDGNNESWGSENFGHPGANVIYAININTGVVTRVAGTGVAGFTGDGSLAVNAKLNIPQYPVLDAAGNLYFVDMSNNVIRVVNMQETTQTLFGVSVGAGCIETIAGNGTSGNSGNGGPATSAEITTGTFQGAEGGNIVFDPSGNLWQADPANNVLRKVSPSGIISQTLGALHIQGDGDTGDGEPIEDCELLQPAWITFDPSGNLYISDPAATIIRAVNYQATTQNILNVTIPSGYIDTIAGQLGGSGESGDGGQAIDCAFNINGPLTTDSSGNLYISQFAQNFRIRQISTTGIITTVCGNGDAGDTGNNGAATSAKVGAVDNGLCYQAFGPGAVTLSVEPTSLAFNNLVWCPTLPSVGSGAPGFGQQGPQALSLTATGGWTISSATGLALPSPSSGSGNSTVLVGINSNFNFPRSLLYVAHNRIRSGTYTDTLTLTSGVTSVQVPVVYSVGYGDLLDSTTTPNGNLRIKSGIVIQPPPD